MKAHIKSNPYKTVFPINDFVEVETPFYYYDIKLLKQTLEHLKKAKSVNPAYRVHYALKACTNPEVLSVITSYGLGADTVSGGEILEAVNAGFDVKSIIFAGVGKTDKDILTGLTLGIGCFNIESIEELQVISEIANAHGMKAPVCLRINPDIDSDTHHFISTGKKENKFGISLEAIDNAVDMAMLLPGIEFLGFHFHIGSQITNLLPYKLLCSKIREIMFHFNARGLKIKMLNVGGGLGVDYQNPDEHLIPDFKAYFELFNEELKLEPGQTLHFELGRSIVAQCGSLISRVLYVKEGIDKRFAIIDAGMNDLIRPALYGAHHKIENITAVDELRTAKGVYDVVGPICESSDSFAESYEMPMTRRGDLIAIRSAGAYGQSMASCYNSRPLTPTFKHLDDC